MLSIVNILTYLKCPISNKNYNTYEAIEESDHFTGRKKLTRTIPEEAQTLDFLEKDFKLIVLKILRELEVIRYSSGMIKYFQN